MKLQGSSAYGLFHPILEHLFDFTVFKQVDTSRGGRVSEVELWLTSDIRREERARRNAETLREHQSGKMALELPFISRL